MCLEAEGKSTTKDTTDTQYETNRSAEDCLL